MTDELDIQRVLAQYCHHCDDGNFDELLALFAADGEFVYGARVCRGREELLTYFQEKQGKPAQRGKHLTLNPVVDIAGERASVLSDFLFLRLVDGEIAPAVTGRYRDLFVRHENRWRIARREVLRMDAAVS